MDDGINSRSWFVVFNNPAEHGYIGTPEEICNKLKIEWCTTDTRTGAWLYCISANGLHHVHMVLEDSITMRFTKVKKDYAVGSHFEPTKGNKQQAENYINKIGKWEEKGEQILYKTVQGELKGKQGQRTDIDDIFDMINMGLTPRQVVKANPNNYRYEGIIKKIYFEKRDEETPLIRKVNVIWHTGESGSGKSFSRVKLANEVGEDNIYYLTDFGTGMFDGYNGQSVLWIEDFKGEMKFGELLRILDVYKADIHCRYTNAKALWTEIHITSIYHPKAVYRKMLDEDVQADEKIEQLMRRISFLRYHIKIDLDYYETDFQTSDSIEFMRMTAYATVINKKGTVGKQSPDFEEI